MSWLSSPSWVRSCAVLALASSALSAQNPTFTSLYSFDYNDPEPFGGLVQATNGNLYGAASGDPDTPGEIFQISPDGVFTGLFGFDYCSSPPCSDGANPGSTLIQATNGYIYGTTFGGGAANSGTVFKMTLSGELTTIYSFCAQIDCTDGSAPGPLIQAANGDLYGVTSGGAYGNGTIFKMSLAGKLTTLYTFCSQNNCPDGSAPNGVIQGSDGNFYGTTHAGGAFGVGTVFKITPLGTLTTLHSFCAQSGCPDGEYPYANLFEATTGVYYGTTFAGGISGCGNYISCGTIFKISPTGTLTTVYAFCSDPACPDGNLPRGPLSQGTDGLLYGTTSYTIYNLTLDGSLTTLSSSVSVPQGALVQDTNGNFYGTDAYGGALAVGQVFELSMGLSPFVQTQTKSGAVGTFVKILGTNLTGSKAVSFNGTEAAFQVVSASEILARVPFSAKSGIVYVVTPSGTIPSKAPFFVLR